MTSPSYSGYRFPPDLIQRAIRLYLRFTLSYRDVEELLAEHGVEGEFLGVLVQTRRDRRAALRLIRKLLKKQSAVPAE